MIENYDVSDVTSSYDGEAEGMPKLIDFYADWCGPCQRQGPIVDELESIYEGRVEFEKVNVDDNNELADLYGVKAIPTLVILDDKGEEVDRYVGLTDRNTLSEALDELLK